MSETVSFLGGAAIAGLAALLLLRGGGTLISASPPSLPTSPAAPSAITPPPAPVPVTAASPPAVATGQQEEARKAEAESLKLQLDQQKLEIEKLKYQIQRQDGFIQTMAQARAANPPAAVALVNPQSAQIQAAAADRTSPVLTNLLWAAGGVTVCLVGGTLLLGAVAAVSRQSRNRVSPIAYPVSRMRLVPYRRRYPQPEEPYILPDDDPYMPAYHPESQPIPRRADYRHYE